MNQTERYNLEKIKCIRCRNIHFMLLWVWELIKTKKKSWYFNYDCPCSENRCGKRVIYKVVFGDEYKNKYD